MNRLSNAVSPYLLQHADNPVHWSEWGEEAFARARREDRPVFLSIGYATCHWCHVMAHESFEDEDVAALLNEHFVSIKLDREERPDVDALYMTYCQAATGQGGWPLTVFLTPDREPFFVGTYYPKHGRGNRPGMMELLPAIARAWRDGREKVMDSAANMTVAVRDSLVGRAAEERVDRRAIDTAVGQLSGGFDERYGGFGRAPKFPTPHNVLFLLREHRRTGERHPLEMSVKTLERMRLGGIWDHVGFGFHRYSTDREWKLPHFEKMLYDQALSAMAFTDAWHITGHPFFRQTVEEIFEYVDDRLTSPHGAFFSAEDADSLNPDGEMEEGAFYVWSLDDLEELLGADDARIATEAFNLERGGNFLDEATRQPTGTNVLHLGEPIAAKAERLKLEPDDLAEHLERIRVKLYGARKQRPRPLLDDKVLTDWNGLMIAALARAAWAFNTRGYAGRARRAAEWILDELCDVDGRLIHRYRDGVAGIRGMADDYAFMAWGLLELHQATFEPRWLREATALADRLIEHFWDAEQGGLFLSPADGEDLLIRQKAYYDGATPSANSVAAYVFIRLAHLTGRIDLEDRAIQILDATRDIADMPIGHTMSLMAVQLLDVPPREIVISGDPDDARTRAMIEVLRDPFLPDTVRHLRPPEATELEKVAPFVAAQTMNNGRPLAYVCERFTCRVPISSPDALRKELAGRGR